VREALIYRLIFLFAAEDRGLLHPAGTSDQARRFYAEGYSLARLRERSMRRTAWDRHADTWEGLKATFRALMRGQDQLGLPALGGLFAHGVVPDLETARIENRRLLAAIWRVAWLRLKYTRRRGFASTTGPGVTRSALTRSGERFTRSTS
jgi:hypothetical protein